MTQATMNFDVPAPHNGTPTSRLGAEAAQPNVAAQCQRVLAYLRTRPDGATNMESRQRHGHTVARGLRSAGGVSQAEFGLRQRIAEESGRSR